MKISVIIPIYNASKYLNKCVTSVLSQTWQDYEVLLIDDGSSDESGEIIDKWGKVDSKIRCIHKENRGLVSTRKRGVLEARGDYICWVDADDWVENTFLEDFIEEMHKSEADAVVMALVQNIGVEEYEVRNTLDNGVYRIEDIAEKMLYSGDFYEYGIGPHLVTKMFRREDLLETQLLVDDNIRAGEDAAVSYPTLLKCKKICVYNKANYHYVQHSGSMTKTENDKEYERIQKVIDHLQIQFKMSGKYEALKVQLKIYKNYLMCLRQFEKLNDKEHLLKPYGGLQAFSRVIIYGAGVLGQKIMEYLRSEEKIKVVTWIDKNYMKYRKEKIKVDGPKVLNKLEEQYDYILIANITHRIAEEIRCELINVYNISNNKILWFTKEFQEGEI